MKAKKGKGQENVNYNMNSKNTNNNMLTNAAEAVYSISGMMPTRNALEHEYANYAEYIESNSASSAELDEQRANKLNPAPLISLVIVSAEENGGSIEDTLDSIVNQTYDNWEVCVVLGYSKRKLESYADSKRMRIILSMGDEESLTSIANQQLRGAYMMQLIAGDVLAPEALYSMAQALLAGIIPEAVFADSEQVDGDGKVYPFFKPDYGLLTLLNYNSAGRPLLVSKRVFDAVGGFIGTRRLEQWEFAIKALNEAKHSSHIGRVLLSSRYAQESTLNLNSLNTLDNILKEHTTKRVQAFCSEGMVAGTARIHLLPKKKTQVSLIIPNYADRESLQRCIESIEMRSTYLDYRVFVADDEREDKQLRKYLDALKKTKAAELIKVKPEMPLPAIMNVCANIALNEMLIFLNGDCEVVSPDFIEELIGPASIKNVGAVGGKLVDINDKIVSVGTVIGMNGWWGSPYEGSADELSDTLKCKFIGVQRNVSAVSGAFMAIRGEVFVSAGMFDDTFSGVGWDSELCLRLMRRGFINCFTPYAKAKLYGELPSYDKASESNLNRCYDVFRQTLLAGDKFYNPNFDYAFSEPVLASKPYPAVELNPNYRS